MKIKTEKAVNASKSIGSPIIDGITGKVIAVMSRGAYTKEGTLLSGVTVNPPIWIERSHKPNNNLKSVLGYKIDPNISKKLSSQVQTELIHPDILKISIGLSKDKLRKTLPELEGESEGYKYSYYAPYALEGLKVNLKSAKVTGVRLETVCSIPSGQLSDLTDFFLITLGHPDKVFTRSLKLYNKVPCRDYMVLYWNKERESITIGIRYRQQSFAHPPHLRGQKVYSCDLNIKEGSVPMTKMVYDKDAEYFEGTPKQFNQFFDDWVRYFEEK